MVGELQNKGLKILTAKCDGFSRPEKLQGAEPDIVGWESDRQLLHVGLVVDSETISTKPFQEKMDVLTKLSMGSGNSRGEHVPFYLGMAEDSKNTSDKNLTDKLSPQDNIIKINS